VRDDMIVDAEWVHAQLDDPGYAIIDARPPAEFSGETPGDGIERPGHIPGARNLFWQELIVSSDEPRLKDAQTAWAVAQVAMCNHIAAMPTTRSLTIRGIPDATLARLRARAARHHRSLNGEVLAILARAAAEGADYAAASALGTGAVHEARTAYGTADHVAAAGPAAGASLLDAVDRDALAAVCRRHHIRWLAVFGSHARGDARVDSDIDVVVDFAPGKTPGLGIIRVADSLRPVFDGRCVDLVTRRGLAPRLRERILAEARELYAAR
jgi:uncharacterized protein